MTGSRTMTVARGAALYLAIGGVMAATIAVAGASPKPTATSASAHPTPSTSSHAPAKKKPAIPCATPATTGAVKSGSQAANKAAVHGGAWTGVLERVYVKLSANGSVAGTPNQHTRVSASGDSPVTIRVPVSGPVSKSRIAGRGTPVVNGQAQIGLSPHGSAAQLVDTSFTRKLPLTVAVTYRLNGKPISSSQLTGKSGTVQVTYKLANVSSRRISACFEGFNGTHQHITLNTPEPLLAFLSFTVPKQATSFDAPGASISPDYQGVFAGWTVPLFEPLGPLTQTFTLTMKTSSAAIPAASVFLDVVNPYTLTGKAPATSAAVVGTAEAAVAKSASAVQSTLGSLQQGVNRLLRFTSSSGRDPAGHSPSSGTAVTADLSALSSSIAAVGAKLGQLGTSLGALASGGTGVVTAVSVVAALVNTINTVAANIATRVSELTAQLPVAVQNALQEVQQLNQLVSDLHAFPPRVQHTHPFLKLAADLAIAQAIASKVNGAVTTAQQFAQAIASRVQALQSRVASLATKAVTLKAAAAALATMIQDAGQHRFAAAQGRFAALQGKFAVVASDIKARFARAEAIGARIRNRLAAAVAIAKQDLANALVKGEESVQAGVSQARAQEAQTAAKTQSDLAKANFQYARLLCLDEQAVLNQVPSGSAPSVSEQTGWYLYSIAGTPKSSERQAARSSKRHQRRTARQNKRHQRRQSR